jgi:thermostable 8-oxoguanine DNA glycosylase
VDQLAQSDERWAQYFEAIDEISGINISTISKLAYFYGRVFEGRAALILDNRLIKNTSRWDETSDLKLSYNGAKRQYPQFLKRMHEVAEDTGCRPAQLELFLFAFGSSFSV